VEASEFKGAPLPEVVVVVERSAVEQFATGIIDPNAVYRDPRAAADAGFDAIPAPPTFPFVMHNWGAFADLQPDGVDPAASPVTGAIGALMRTGGMLLHGEQEFEYHRPVQVGDRLRGTGEIEDVYVKESGERVMTFLVTRTDWADDATDAPVCTTRMTLIHRK
jgi:acyl dehydratase